MPCYFPKQEFFIPRNPTAIRRILGDVGVISPITKQVPRRSAHPSASPAFAVFYLNSLLFYSNSPPSPWDQTFSVQTHWEERDTEACRARRVALAWHAGVGRKGKEKQSEDKEIKRAMRVSMDSDVYSNVIFLVIFFDYRQIRYKIYYVNS